MNLNLSEYSEGAVFLDGLESAIIGVVEEFGNGRRILYSKDKILEILQQRDGMTYSESEELFDYNIIGGYFGEQNPVFLDKFLKPVSISGEWEYEIRVIEDAYNP